MNPQLTMTPAHQARALEAKIKNILHFFRQKEFEDQITESEIKFRYDLVVGFLILALKDATNLSVEWSKLEDNNES